MLEKDPQGLIEALIRAGVATKEEIFFEKKRDGSIPIIKLKAYLSFINNEKNLNGPFISADSNSVAKVFPKKFGFNLKKINNDIIFQ